MKNVNLVLMGKTGAGKSTIVNSMLGEEVAETGIGKTVTQKNQRYDKSLFLNDGEEIKLSLYDTVGLEIDNSITTDTIKKIEEHIKSIEENSSEDDVTVVWFCVNYKCNRFEQYELDLIKRLSVDNRIPFVVVLTQCYEDIVGELEKSIVEMMPELAVKHILAKDYKSRIGVFNAYGLGELLELTVNKYPKLKIQITEERILKIQEEYEERKQSLQIRSMVCIKTYAEKAGKIGWVPVFSIPFVLGMGADMIKEINSVFDLRINEEEVEAVVLGIIGAPMMAIPLLSKIAAESYIETIGENYLKALMEVVDKYANYELEKNEEILKTLKKALGRKKT